MLAYYFLFDLQHHGITWDLNKVPFHSRGELSWDLTKVEADHYSWIHIIIIIAKLSQAPAPAQLAGFS